MDLDKLREQNNVLYDKNLSLREEISYLKEKLESARDTRDNNKINVMLSTIAVCVLILVPGIWDNFITVLQFFGVVIMAAVVTEVGNVIAFSLICLGLSIWYYRKKTDNTPSKLPNRY